jgi:hypothetical protein
MSARPPADLLDRLIKGELAGDEGDSIATHVEACAACQPTEADDPRAAARSSLVYLSAFSNVVAMTRQPTRKPGRLMRMRHSRTMSNSGSASYVFRSIERGFVGFIHLTM